MKIELIDSWKQWYTMYSIWAFAAIGMAPDLYNLAVQYSMVSGEAAPVALTRLINTLAFLGACFRLIKQRKLAMEAQKATGEDVKS